MGVFGRRGWEWIHQNRETRAVYNQDDLLTALADSDVNRIVIAGDLTLTSSVYVTSSVTITGSQNHSIVLAGTNVDYFVLRSDRITLDKLRFQTSSTATYTSGSVILVDQTVSGALINGCYFETSSSLPASLTVTGTLDKSRVVNNNFAGGELTGDFDFCVIAGNSGDDCNLTLSGSSRNNTVSSNALHGSMTISAGVGQNNISSNSRVTSFSDTVGTNSISGNIMSGAVTVGTGSEFSGNHVGGVYTAGDGVVTSGNRLNSTAVIGDNCVLTGNRIGATFTGAVTAGDDCAISGNACGAVTTGSNCTVLGNTMSATDVDTSSGTGSAVYGNANVGEHFWNGADHVDQDVFQPHDRLVIYDDFLNFDGSTSHNTSQWVVGNSGTGAAVGIVASTLNGVVDLDTGTDATGRAAFYTNAGTLALDHEKCIYRARVKIPTLGDGTDDFYFSAGLGDSNTATQTDAVMFQYRNATNSGNWTVYCKEAGTATTEDSGVAATTSWVDLMFTSPSGGGSVKFYINGTLTNTISTNVPDTTEYMGVMTNIDKTLGTASRTAQVDYIWFSKYWTGGSR